jgi:SAM-dependent MidA family methyltransferase
LAAEGASAVGGGRRALCVVRSLSGAGIPVPFATQAAGTIDRTMPVNEDPIPLDAAPPAAAALAAPALPPPAAEELARSQALLACIGQRIAQAGGWLPFADFMQMALYEPGLGYYDARGAKFGAHGDFVTAPEISPLFARALAAPVMQAFAQLPAQLLEFGAGTGALAHDLLAELERRGTPAQRYFIVEVSADLRARQRERLAGFPVTWLDQLPEAFEGVVIANEVLDVMPVTLFVRASDAVLERGVCVADDRLRLAARPAAPALRDAVREIEFTAGTLPPGYGSEVCPASGAWVAAVAASLKRGVVLLFDYGFPRREYYHPQRAMGTLMCHYRQHAHADPLWLPGLNDITAHVDFTAIAQAATAAGLDLPGYTSQAHFLINCGILDGLAARLDAANTGAVQRLLSEAEMGELVKVMALARGMRGTVTGFQNGDRRHRL